ncbi:hypothetical protein PENTCL1PPCAC_15228, partial [Pristionchus entomophagus]
QMDDDNNIKHGIVVTVLNGKIGVMGAHGGGPTLFVSEPNGVKVGSWCEVNVATQDIRRTEDVTETTVDSYGLITIKSYLVRFEETFPGTALSPHVGTVVVPVHFNFRKAYVYQANITCHVNSPQFESLMYTAGTAWKLSEHAEILQVEGIEKLTDVESLVVKAGWTNQIELKPKSLDPKDILKAPMTSSGQIPSGPMTQMNGMLARPNQGTSRRNHDRMDSIEKFKESFQGGSEFSGKAVTVPSNDKDTAPKDVPKDFPPIIDPYPYLGVVVSVLNEIIVIYTREEGNIFVDKNHLSMKLKFELTSCNWVKLNYSPNNTGNHTEFNFQIDRIRGATNADLDKDLREIEWAVARYIDSIKLANATLYFVPSREYDLQPGMRVQMRRQGENVVYHPFVGEVIVDQGAHLSIRRHREYFDATVELAKGRDRTVWKVTQFVYDGQELTLNGYMSKIGHGKWQQVRDQNLPRLAQQKEKNLTTKNSCPAPNAAVKGSLGWHIPTLPEPGQEREPAEHWRGAGDVGKPNAAYDDVLAIATSKLAPKVEFA